jgi:hypothetical protein
MAVGVDGNVRLSFVYLSEYFKEESREKYAIGIQVPYSFGYIFICGGMYFIGNWKIVILIFVAIPMIVGLLGTIFLLKETPRFLIR